MSIGHVAARLRFGFHRGLFASNLEQVANPLRQARSQGGARGCAAPHEIGAPPREIVFAPA